MPQASSAGVGKAPRHVGYSQAPRDAVMAEATTGDFYGLLTTVMEWVGEPEDGEEPVAAPPVKRGDGVQCPDASGEVQPVTLSQSSGRSSG